jgi:hypothetical protein
VTAVTTEFDEVYGSFRAMIERTIAWLARPSARNVRYRGIEPTASSCRTEPLRWTSRAL